MHPALRSAPAATGRWLRSVRPERAHLMADLVAGLPGAVSSVPDGMAAAVLVGVNPVQGLYASFAGPIAGGLTSNTRMMVITTTSAAALAAGSALQDVAPAQRPAAVSLLVVMVGIVLVAAGLARLGRYTRFVSYSVMIGFLSGVAVNIVCSQVPDLTGAAARGAFPLAKAVNVVVRPGGIDVASLLAGLGALAILVVLARTRFSVVSALIALVVPTIAVTLAGAGQVARVGDQGDLPRGVPLPHLPDFGLMSFGMITGALAIAAIVLVQGAGVAEAAPNPDGARPNPNQDIIAQGAGNLAAGFWRGVAVGGSVGQTALNVAVGGRTRWAAIWSGVWLLVILALFSGLVAKIAVPTLGAILIFAAVRSLRLAEVTTIMRTGRISQVAVITTFTATLFLPVAAAVGIGVALSLLLQLNQDAMDLAVVELTPTDDGRFVEHKAPAELAGSRVTVLDVYGSLLYAGARTLQAHLPEPGQARSPVVVLRLRGRTSLGATFVKVIADYASRLADCGGRLYLSGLSADIIEQLRHTGRLDGPIRTFEATPVIGESTRAAYLDAEAWLVKTAPEPPEPPEPPGNEDTEDDATLSGAPTQARCGPGSATALRSQTGLPAIAPVPPIRPCPSRSRAPPTCLPGHRRAGSRTRIRRACPGCAAPASAGPHRRPRSAGSLPRLPVPPLSSRCPRRAGPRSSPVRTRAGPRSPPCPQAAMPQVRCAQPAGPAAPNARKPEAPAAGPAWPRLPSRGARVRPGKPPSRQCLNPCVSAGPPALLTADAIAGSVPSSGSRVMAPGALIRSSPCCVTGEYLAPTSAKVQGAPTVHCKSPR